MRRLAQILLHGGLFAIVLGLSKFHAGWVADPTYDFTASFRLPWAIVYSVALAVSAYAVGLPDMPRGRRELAAAHAVSVVLATGVLSGAQLLVGSPLLPRFVIMGTVAATIPLFATSALLARRGRAAASDVDRVVVIGSQEDSFGLAEELRKRSERPATVVAVLPTADAMPTAGAPMPVCALVDTHGASVVVLDREAQAVQGIVDQVALLHERGVRVRTLSLFYEQWLGKLPIGELERVSLLFDIGEIHRLRYGRLKRMVDLAVAVALLPVLALVVPVVWVGDRLANRGPLLYHQDRVGKGGRPFRIHKFRSMLPASAGDGASLWTAEDDDRVTPFGRFLRTTHIDELPQLVNILRGELSLVGPRPEQVHYVDELEAKLPYYQLRHLVQPGLTGWAQVKFGYARSDGDALEKLQFEFYYLRHQGLALDMRILARTSRTILAGEGG